MPPQLYRARVSEHTLVHGKFQWVIFELVSPNQIDFQAGQYLMMNIPDMDAKRSYSIASPPANRHQLDILVDIGPQGDGSMYLQSLNPGEEVRFMAPAGAFVQSNDPEEHNLIFIATGSGISAIRSMILDLLQTKADPRSITLHWGMRHVDDIFWEEDFRLLEKQFDNFHFDLVLSKAPPEWPLCTGHVTDCLLHHHQSFANTGFYLCGNNQMITSVSTMLAEKSVKPQHIHHERFF
jgi:phenol/toluene 2-monooxygenase (NADH) P5/A5